MPQRVTIVGGGLAGISLGIGLRLREVPVKLLEATQYPRHRVCGEFISGISDDSLERLGIRDILDQATRHRSTAWYFAGREVFRSDMPATARGISRYRLDQQLIDRYLSLGGELETRTRYTGNAAPGMIFASGRPNTKGSQWLGIKCHLLDYQLSADLEMHLGDGAYLGLSGVEDGRVNACGLFKLRREVKAPRLELMTAYLRACGLHDMAEKVATAEKDEHSCLGVNAFEFGWQSQPDEDLQTGKLRIGDQCAIIGPFSGNGMSMAFQSSAVALDPVNDWATGDCSWQDTCQTVSVQLRQEFRRRLQLSSLLHPFLTDPTKQRLITTLGRARLLPYETLFRVLR